MAVKIQRRGNFLEESVTLWGSTATITTSAPFTAAGLSLVTSKPMALYSSRRWVRLRVRVIIPGVKFPAWARPLAMLVPMFPAPRMAIRTVFSISV